MPKYSENVIKRLFSPTNQCSTLPYNGEGTIEKVTKSRQSKRSKLTRVTFRIAVKEAFIVGASWEVFGGPVAYAAASWCVENIIGSTIGDLANKITPEVMALDLEITDEFEIRSDCMVVIEALIAAIENYHFNHLFIDP